MGFLAAAIQLTTNHDPQASLSAAKALVDEAAKRGATFIALPENVHFMGSEQEKLRLAETLDGPTFQQLARLAQHHGVWLLGGTLPERGPHPGVSYNTSVLFGPDGQRHAVYRKIHLFDVALGQGATHKESESVAPGDRLALAKSPLATFGLSICYDLRFPGLYRTLAREGAEVLTVPAAFTVPTGRDHWEVLLRARAIENQCFVIAPGQVGHHGNGRRTFGRSMIIDPWGTVLATAPDRPGVILAQVDLDALHALRTRLPCLAHERPQTYRVT